MSIALTDEHRALADVASDLLTKREARSEARAFLDAETEQLPSVWSAVAELGWLGLHVDATYGGSGFGLAEQVIVVEALGRALAPGPFVPTVIASAVIGATGSDTQRGTFLPGLTDGSTVGAVGLEAELEIRAGRVFGSAEAVLGGAVADIALLPHGDDVLVVRLKSPEVTATVPRNLDPTRQTGRLVIDGAAADVLVGGHRILVDRSRVLLAAEAVGIAHACADMAAQYANTRRQFGHVIGTFQAVKHHCADMFVAAELATGAVWSAARSVDEGDATSGYAAALASVVALPAAERNAQLNIQVHGGVGYTWEHDAHLYLRRAAAAMAFVGPVAAAEDVFELARSGIRLTRSIELPPEAAGYRAEVQEFCAGLDGLDAQDVLDSMVMSGYAVPHWPRPWGRDASPVEQLVIEEVLGAAGISRPVYGITAWVVLTLAQHASDAQAKRWIRPALVKAVSWCQLFSEPEAGSDAAAVRTTATRTAGGWLLNGQKVWTSGAHTAEYGLATVRTDSTAPKHRGITTMAVDMSAPGVEIRPLRNVTGDCDFNEVFFNEVFVPDEDVVGQINDGWNVARATLGNESVTIGGGQQVDNVIAPEHLLSPDVGAPGEDSALRRRIGTYVAHLQAVDSLNLRSTLRAVLGSGPGPEGALTKLVLSELAQDAASILFEMAHSEGVYLDGSASFATLLELNNRGGSIAGGTSEIKRNQIAERILGLPRDPLTR
jgi:alkylation response protein AidB-like acyl-CoA dehydrogenase